MFVSPISALKTYQKNNITAKNDSLKKGISSNMACDSVSFKGISDDKILAIAKATKVQARELIDEIIANRELRDWLSLNGKKQYSSGKLPTSTGGNFIFSVTNDEFCIMKIGPQEILKFFGGALFKITPECKLGEVKGAGISLEDALIAFKNGEIVVREGREGSAYNTLKVLEDSDNPITKKPD